MSAKPTKRAKAPAGDTTGGNEKRRAEPNQKVESPAESSTEPQVKQRVLCSRHQRFVREYLVDLNGTQAAIRSGYSEHSAAQIAYELLQNPLVRARIEELQDDRAAALAIKAEDVVAGLIKIRDRSMQAEEVVAWDFEEKCFQPTGEWKFDSNGANKASELIGKHLGMYQDKLQISGALSLGTAIRARKEARLKAEAEKQGKSE